MSTSDSELSLTTHLQPPLNSDDDEETLEFSLNSKNSVFLKNEKNKVKSRRVRFSTIREIRRMPKSLEHDAKMARLPYQTKVVGCSCVSATLAFNYAVYFAPLVNIYYLHKNKILVVFNINNLSNSACLFNCFVS